MNGRGNPTIIDAMDDRPKYAGKISKEVALEQLEKLASMHATEQEMAAFFDMSLQRFNERVSANPAAQEAIEAGRAKGRLTLRRYQMKMAESNASMAIFLGKVMLGQKDYLVAPPSAVNGGNVGDDAREALYVKLRTVLERRENATPGEPETIQ